MAEFNQPVESSPAKGGEDVSRNDAFKPQSAQAPEQVGDQTGPAATESAQPGDIQKPTTAESSSAKGGGDVSRNDAFKPQSAQAPGQAGEIGNQAGSATAESKQSAQPGDSQKSTATESSLTKASDQAGSATAESKQSTQPGDIQKPAAAESSSAKSGGDVSRNDAFKPQSMQASEQVGEVGNQTSAATAESKLSTQPGDSQKSTATESSLTKSGDQAGSATTESRQSAQYGDSQKSRATESSYAKAGGDANWNDAFKPQSAQPLEKGGDQTGPATAESKQSAQYSDSQKQPAEGQLQKDATGQTTADKTVRGENVTQLEKLSPELQEQVKSAQRARNEIGNVPGDKAVAAVEKGPRALSGWNHGKTDFVDPKQATADVQKQSDKMGYKLTPSGYLDKGIPGRYNASHAEKQMSVTAPDRPIAVSQPMCDDCPKYFSTLAAEHDKPQIVADPERTTIFYPDGKRDVLLS